MDSFLIFDIETVPDIESGASILGLANLSDEEVIKAMEHTKFQKNWKYYSAKPFTKNYLYISNI
jgi:predicted PolB exonuclease-like 3'-5' exonuclease